MAADTPPNSECSSGDLAEAFGVSTKTIERLADQGIAVRRGRGNYDWKKSVFMYVSLTKEQGDADEYAQEKLRELRSRRIHKEEQIKRLRHETCETAEVVRVVTEAFVAIKSQLLARQQRLAGRLGSAFGSDPNKALQVLQTADNDLLKDIHGLDVGDFTGGSLDPDLFDSELLEKGVQAGPDRDAESVERQTPGSGK